MQRRWKGCAGPGRTASVVLGAAFSVTAYSNRAGRNYWQCSDCREQTTVIAGTILQATKLPLTLWLLAMHLLTQAKNYVSALELKRHLGVCYRTACLVKHKLLQV